VHVGGIKASHIPKAADLPEALNTSFTSLVIPLDRKSRAASEVSQRSRHAVGEDEVSDISTERKAEAGLESSMCIEEVLEGF